MNYLEEENVNNKYFTENTVMHALNNHKETIQFRWTTRFKQNLTEFNASPKIDQSSIDKAYNLCISRAFRLSS